MTSMHQDPLLPVFRFLLFQHVDSVFIPLFYRSQSLGSLLILFKQFLFVIISLLDLFLLLQLDYQFVSKIINEKLHLLNVVLFLNLNFHLHGFLELLLLFLQLSLSPLIVKNKKLRLKVCSVILCSCFEQLMTFAYVIDVFGSIFSNLLFSLLIIYVFSAFIFMMDFIVKKETLS